MRVENEIGIVIFPDFENFFEVMITFYLQFIYEQFRMKSKFIFIFLDLNIIFIILLFQHILNGVLPCGRKYLEYMSIPDKRNISQEILSHILSYYHSDSAVEMSPHSEAFDFLLQCLKLVVDGSNWLYLRTLKQVCGNYQTSKWSTDCHLCFRNFFTLNFF